MLKRIRRNPVNTFFVAAIGGCLIFSSGNLKQQADAIASLRGETAKNNQNNMQLKVSMQDTQMSAEIAEERYKKGCLKLKGALVQGKPVYRSGEALSKGTIVCDRLGNTGKLIPRDFDNDGIYSPVVGETAYTGNSEVVSNSFGGK